MIENVGQIGDSHSALLEGRLSLSRGPVGPDGSDTVSSNPFIESAHGCLIETGPDQSRDIASVSRRLAV